MTIKVYISKNCKPCDEVKQLIDQGKYEGEIEVVDVETDEGFGEFNREVLEHGDGAVPSAYKEGAKCKILIDEDRGLMFHCPSEPDSQQEEGRDTDNSGQ